jgi:hypothetical protein
MYTIRLTHTLVMSLCETWWAYADSAMALNTRGAKDMEVEMEIDAESVKATKDMIDQATRALALARAKLEATKVSHKLAAEAAHATPEWQAFTETVLDKAIAEEEERAAYQGLTQLVMLGYDTFDLVHPNELVEVRMMRVPVYDEGAAIMWCRAHLMDDYVEPPKLRVPVFEKAVLAGIIDINVAQVITRPKAFVAKDLSGILPKEDNDIQSSTDQEDTSTASSTVT